MDDRSLQAIGAARSGLLPRDARVSSRMEGASPERGGTVTARGRQRGLVGGRFGLGDGVRGVRAEEGKRFR